VIFFKQKPAPAVPAPAAPPAKVEGPERIDDAAIARRKKTDSDGTLRRKRQTAEDNRLL
jgi:hypothetical protein